MLSDDPLFIAVCNGDILAVNSHLVASNGPEIFEELHGVHGNYLLVLISIIFEK